MIIESQRVLGFLPQFFRAVRTKPLAAQKFFSTSLNEKVNEETKPNESNQNADSEELTNLRFKYPEFLPDPIVKWRNPLREKLERRDMLRRRKVITIPEFYVGSVLAVTSSNAHALGKTARFVGICIMRQYCGLRSQFLLRNVIENQGVEVLYNLYSPLIQKIEVLRFEKRLDNELYYLRDAPHEYSTFPFDMQAEYFGDKTIVPVNTLKVPLNPRPWQQRYERMGLKGAVLPELPARVLERAKKGEAPWEKYDLMDQYRKTIPEEEQKDIFSEIYDELKELQLRQKSEKRKKVFVKPPKQKLF